MSSIKCSSCGRAISISSLQTHICDASLGKICTVRRQSLVLTQIDYVAPAPPRNQFKLDLPKNESAGYGYYSKNMYGLPTPVESSWNNKPLPPRIDPDYASKYRGAAYS
jgi:hypothetical protein